MIRQRVAELRQEYEKGREEMLRLESRRSELHAMLLRISGAIQVLEELEAAASDGRETGPAPLAAVS